MKSESAKIQDFSKSKGDFSDTQQVWTTPDSQNQE